MVTKFLHKHHHNMYNIFHNWNEIKRWPEVAGNYPERCAALAGKISSFRRRPAMVWLGTGGVCLLGVWASKPRWWPDLERPESTPAKMGFQAVRLRFRVDLGSIFLPP
jgi:hypothetical protein